MEGIKARARSFFRKRKRELWFGKGNIRSREYKLC
jgi:hypothetical protein